MPGCVRGADNLLLLRQGAGGAAADAAVHEEGLCGDVAAFFAGEEDERAFEIVHGTGALKGDAIAEVLYPFGVLIHDGVLRGLEPTRGEDIYGDAMEAPVIGEGHGHLLHATAAGSIGGEAGVPGDAGDAADEDDAAVLGGDHEFLGGLLGEEEGAAEVRVENEVPVVPGDIHGGLADVAAGVADEDVKLAIVGLGGLHGGGDAFEGADVELEGKHFATEVGDALHDVIK